MFKYIWKHLYNNSKLLSIFLWILKLCLEINNNGFVQKLVSYIKMKLLSILHEV